MGLVETEGIILRTYKLAEADKIVICLTQRAGLVRGVARGARRLRSRFGASLEPLTLVSLSYFEKEGRELVALRHAEILRSYFGLARSAETVAALEYLSELALEFAPPHEPNEKLFRMVRACVEALAHASGNLHAVVRYYEVWTLRLAGFLPGLRACAACGRRLEGAGVTIYLDVEGALRCGSCSGSTGVPVSAEVYAQLRAIQMVAPADWISASERFSKAAHHELARLTERLLARALERAPRGQATFI